MNDEGSSLLSMHSLNAFFSWKANVYYVENPGGTLDIKRTRNSFYDTTTALKAFIKYKLLESAI